MFRGTGIGKSSTSLLAWVNSAGRVHLCQVVLYTKKLDVFFKNVNNNLATVTRTTTSTTHYKWDTCMWAVFSYIQGCGSKKWGRESQMRSLRQNLAGIFAHFNCVLL